MKHVVPSLTLKADFSDGECGSQLCPKTEKVSQHLNRQMDIEQ